MTDQAPEKKRPGRKEGWRKNASFKAKLPPIRVPDEIADWLESERVRIGLSTISDVMRLKLSEKRQDEQRKGQEDRRDR